MNAYLDAMRRSFDFAGRSTRGQYWLYTLIYFVGLIVLTLLDGLFGTLAEDGVGFLNSLGIIIHLIPSISVTVRRLHDSGRSGWWMLIGLVPLVGLITLIVFACLPSQPGANRFDGNRTDNRADPALAPAPASHEAGGGLPLDQLEKLSALKESGAIDEDEFKAMKADLLAKAVRS